MSKNNNGLKKKDDDDDEEDAKDAIERQERDYKSKVMKEEYKRIMENVAEVERHCTGLENKVSNFRGAMDETVNQLKHIDEEEINLPQHELIDRIQGGKIQQEKLARTTTMHSNNMKCPTCGQGHSSEDCTLQNAGDAAPKGFTYTKITAESIKNKLNNIQEENPNDIKKKKVVDIKNDKKLWEKLSKREKAAYQEKEAFEKTKLKFVEDAENVRQKVKQQYQDAIARERPEFNYLEKFDEQKEKIKERMELDKDDRALVMGDDDDEARKLPENKEKIEEMKKKHDLLMEDQGNFEKFEELKQNHQNIVKDVLVTKNQNEQEKIAKKKNGSYDDFEKKENFSELMKLLEVDHKGTLDEALDNIVEKRNIDIKEMTDKHMRTMSVSINHTLQKEGAPIITDQADVDAIIESYIRRRQENDESYLEKKKAEELLNQPEETEVNIIQRGEQHKINIMSSKKINSQKESTKHVDRKSESKILANIEESRHELNENNKSNKDSKNLNISENINSLKNSKRITGSVSQSKQGENIGSKVEEDIQDKTEYNIQINVGEDIQDSGEEDIQDNEGEDIQDSGEEDIQDNTGENMQAKGDKRNKSKGKKQNKAKNALKKNDAPNSSNKVSSQKSRQTQNSSDKVSRQKSRQTQKSKLMNELNKIEEKSVVTNGSQIEKDNSYIEKQEDEILNKTTSILEDDDIQNQAIDEDVDLEQVINITEEILNNDTNFIMNEETEQEIQDKLNNQLEHYEIDEKGQISMEDGKEILERIIIDAGAPGLHETEIISCLKEHDLDTLGTFNFETLNLAAQKTIAKSLSKPIEKEVVEKYVKEAFQSFKGSTNKNVKNKTIPTKDLKNFINTTISKQFNSKIKVQALKKVDEIIKKNTLQTKNPFHKNKVRKFTHNVIKTNQINKKMKAFKPITKETRKIPAPALNLDQMIDQEIKNVDAKNPNHDETEQKRSQINRVVENVCKTVDGVFLTKKEINELVNKYEKYCPDKKGKQRKEDAILIAKEAVLINGNYRVKKRKIRVPRKIQPHERQEASYEMQKKLAHELKAIKDEYGKVQNISTEDCIEKVKDEITNLDSDISKKYFYIHKALQTNYTNIDIKKRINEELDKIHKKFAAQQAAQLAAEQAEKKEITSPKNNRGDKGGPDNVKDDIEDTENIKEGSRSPKSLKKQREYIRNPKSPGSEKRYQSPKSTISKIEDSASTIDKQEDIKVSIYKVEDSKVSGDKQESIKVSRDKQENRQRTRKLENSRVSSNKQENSKVSRDKQENSKVSRNKQEDVMDLETTKENSSNLKNIEMFSEEIMQAFNRIEDEQYNEKAELAEQYNQKVELAEKNNEEVDLPEEFNEDESMYEVQEFEEIINIKDEYIESQDEHNESQIEYDESQDQYNESQDKCNDSQDEFQKTESYIRDVMNSKDSSIKPKYRLSNRDIAINNKEESNTQLTEESKSINDKTDQYSKNSQRTQQGLQNHKKNKFSKFAHIQVTNTTEGNNQEFGYDTGNTIMLEEHNVDLNHHKIRKIESCDRCEKTRKFLTRFPNIKLRNNNIETVLLDFCKYDSKGNFFSLKWPEHEIKKTIAACEVEIDCLLEILALVTEFSQYAQKSLFLRTGPSVFLDKHGKTKYYKDFESKEPQLQCSTSRDRIKKIQNCKSNSIQNSIEKEDIVLPPQKINSMKFNNNATLQQRNIDQNVLSDKRLEKLKKTTNQLHASPFRLDYIKQQNSKKHHTHTFEKNINNKLVKLQYESNSLHPSNEKGLIINEQYIKHSQSNVGSSKKKPSNSDKHNIGNSQDKIIEENHILMHGGPQKKNKDRFVTAEDYYTINKSSSNKKAQKSSECLRNSFNTSRKKFKHLVNYNSSDNNQITEEDSELALNVSSKRKIPKNKMYHTDIINSKQNSSTSLNKNRNYKTIIENNDMYDDNTISFYNKNEFPQSTQAINNHSVEVLQKNGTLVEVRAKIARSEMKNLLKVLNNINGIKELEFDECSRSAESLHRLADDVLAAHQAHSNSQSKDRINLGYKTKVRNKISDKQYSELNDYSPFQARKTYQYSKTHRDNQEIKDNHGNSLMEREKRGMLKKDNKGVMNQVLSTSRKRVM